MADGTVASRCPLTIRDCNSSQPISLYCGSCAYLAVIGQAVAAVALAALICA